MLRRPPSMWARSNVRSATSGTCTEPCCRRTSRARVRSAGRTGAARARGGATVDQAERDRTVGRRGEPIR
ncbi:hypothetical protein ACFPRL_01735 [Pseudoclavibacter helvolus]